MKRYTISKELIACLVILTAFGPVLAQGPGWTPPKVEDRFGILAHDKRTCGPAKPPVQGAMPPDVPDGLVSLGSNSAGYNQFFCNIDGSVMIYVPAGDFIMGSDDGPKDSRPSKRVTLAGFFVDKYEMNHARAVALCADFGLPSYGDPAAKDLDPMAVFPYRLVIMLAERLGKSLPTEAQWEKAARGTDGRFYPWGTDPVEAKEYFRANLMAGNRLETAGRDGFVVIAPIGSFPAGASPYGCQDMAGNLWEWCLDRYDSAAYTLTGTVDPKVGWLKNPDLQEVVCRGGSWSHPEPYLRCYVRSRSSYRLSNAGRTMGFRFVFPHSDGN